VLLIEDNEDAMVLVRIALQDYGKGVYRLEWSEGLSGGLERLTKGGVDLVLLDLGLPDSSGPESYAWVHEVAPEIPVLVLTGDTREETQLAVTACGVQDYLIKDRISGSVLLQAIRAAINSSRMRENKLLKLAESQGELSGQAHSRSFVPAEPDCQN
jgi:DNA-binding NarL/FixJ family response regulator